MGAPAHTLGRYVARVRIRMALPLLALLVGILFVVVWLHCLELGPDG